MRRDPGVREIKIQSRHRPRIGALGSTRVSFKTSRSPGSRNVFSSRNWRCSIVCPARRRHHHSGIFAASERALRNQFPRQVVIVIAKPHAHRCMIKEIASGRKILDYHLPMTQPALDFVIAALEKIREASDRAPRVSMTALARLQGADPVAASLREARASPTERRLQPAHRTRQNYLSRFANASALARNARISPARAHKRFSA